MHSGESAKSNVRRLRIVVDVAGWPFAVNVLAVRSSDDEYARCKENDSPVHCAKCSARSSKLQCNVIARHGRAGQVSVFLASYLAGLVLYSSRLSTHFRVPKLPS